VPTIRSQPNADLTPLEWSKTPGGGTHVSKIDETIAAKDNTDYIRGMCDSADRDEHGYPADSPANMDEVTLVDCEMYYWGYDFMWGCALRIELYVGAVSKGVRVFSANTGSTWQVRSFQVTPSPVLSKADYDALDIRLKAQAGTGDIPQII
jgi:hypothetical protein